MATMKLTPSSYYLSNSSYLSVASADNMYTDTSSTTYATVTNSRTSTTSYYIYLQGFNFDDIPSGAVVSSFTIKLKANESGASTSDSYKPYLADGTTAINGSCDVITTTVTTHTFSGLSADWDTIVGYGSDFGIRINCRRASRNTTSYVYIYGAEIQVTYTIPDPCTVTSSLNGEGTISPSGAYNTAKGQEYTITITPNDTTAEVSATLDGSNITLTPHYADTTLSTVLGAYALKSGSFNSGASWFEGIVGNGYDTTETTTSNYYSSSSGTQTVFSYQMHVTGIPSNATIERVYVMVNGHAESTSNSSEYMCVQLVSGSTDISDQVNFKQYGTTNQTITVEATTIPTIAQLESMELECTLGYYGGAINGATLFVEYSVPSSNPQYYTYTFTTTSISHTIIVTIGSGGAVAKIYKKVNNSWSEMSYTKVYKKVNGAWVEQTSLTSAFDSNTNYVWG